MNCKVCQKVMDAPEVSLMKFNNDGMCFDCRTRYYVEEEKKQKYQEMINTVPPEYANADQIIMKYYKLNGKDIREITERNIHIQGVQADMLRYCWGASIEIWRNSKPAKMVIYRDWCMDYKSYMENKEEEVIRLARYKGNVIIYVSYIIDQTEREVLYRILDSRSINNLKTILAEDIGDGKVASDYIGLGDRIKSIINNPENKYIKLNVQPR